MGRRHVLRNAGLAMGGALAATAATASPAFAGSGGRDDGNDAMTLAGAWMIERREPSNGFVGTGVFTFAAGGTMTYIDIAPVTSLLIGAWAGSGRRYKYTMWLGLGPDENGAPTNVTVRIGGPIELIDRRHFTHSYRTTFILAATGEEVFTVDGTATGTRFDA